MSSVKCHMSYVICNFLVLFLFLLNFCSSFCGISCEAGRGGSVSNGATLSSFLIYTVSAFRLIQSLSPIVHGSVCAIAWDPEPRGLESSG